VSDQSEVAQVVVLEKLPVVGGKVEVRVAAYVRTAAVIAGVGNKH
jgi:hypothetical protein